MLRLGIAGIGQIARDYLSILDQVPDVQLTALCSRNRDSLRQATRDYQLDVALFTDYAEMLSSDCIDAVLICTPHGAHPAMTCQALEAGLHVLVEKPVGIYGDEVEQALALLEKNPRLRCGVMYNRRASQAYQYVKELMAGERIGALVRCTWIITDLYRTNAYYRSAAWRGSWEQEGGGMLMTQASHQLDLLQWICGMPTQVLARLRCVDRPTAMENEAELLLSFPGGARGQFLASAHESPGRNFLEICGTKGRITVREDAEVTWLPLSVHEPAFARHCPNPFDKVPMDDPVVRFFDDSDNRIQQAATIENFALAVQGKAKLQCSLAEGLNSLQIIHGAYLSQWQQSCVRLPASEADFRAALEAKIAEV